MKPLTELVPDEKTMYHLSNMAIFRLHNNHYGGMISTNIRKSLTQCTYEYIDAFPSIGGNCIVTVKFDKSQGIWVDVEQLTI